MIFFSEGHGNYQVIHLNLLRICFIDTGKWKISEKKNISRFQILDLAHWKKALNKGCDKNFDI